LSSQVNTFRLNPFIELQLTFKHYDADKSGTINASEFKKILIDLGKRDVTDEQANEMLKQVDKNNDSVIQWSEFLDVLSCIVANTNIDV